MAIMWKGQREAPMPKSYMMIRGLVNGNARHVQILQNVPPRLPVLYCKWYKGPYYILCLLFLKSRLSHHYKMCPSYLTCNPWLNMSTVVYQGLQSHLESQIMETKSLKLKLSSPKLFFSQSLEMALVVVPSDCDSKKPDIPISPSSYRLFPTHPPCEKLQGPYVHPSAKHSSWLSEKSLHLCTENLGSETGSEFIENSIFSSSTSELFKIPVKKEQQQTRNRQVREPKKQFPPPLTTLYGSDSLHLIRPYREDGRVILKATRAPISRGCFQIDRSNGRVRLSLADSTMHVCGSKQEKDDDKIMT